MQWHYDLKKNMFFANVVLSLVPNTSLFVLQESINFPEDFNENESEMQVSITHV